jgi:anti-sigma-K factor RskA
VLHGLQDAPPGRSYQAWVVSKRGARPASAALFSSTETVVPLSVPVPPGAVVAVTVEPAGGVSSPAGKLRLAATRPSSS